MNRVSQAAIIIGLTVGCGLASADTGTLQRQSSSETAPTSGPLIKMRNPEVDATGTSQGTVAFSDMNDRLRQQALSLGYLADEKITCRVDRNGGISFRRCGTCEWSLVAATGGNGQIVYQKLPPRKETWRRHRPFPKTEHPQAVAYGNGVYVSLSKEGSIYTSADGMTWTKREIESAPTFTGVTWGGNRFVAVGFAASKIFTSPNGADWTPHSLGKGRMLKAVAWGANRYVAVGDFGTILTSKDGADWTEQTSAMRDGINDIIFAANRFVAVGWGGDNSDFPGKILISSDGTKWTVSQVAEKGALNSVAYGGGVFVAVKYDNAILLSRDARSWTRQSLGKQHAYSLHKVIWDGNRFIASGSWHPGCNSYYGALLTSPDGIEWNSQEFCGWGTITSIAQGSNQLLGVRDDGSVVTSTVREVAESGWSGPAGIPSGSGSIASSDPCKSPSVAGMVIIDRTRGMTLKGRFVVEVGDDVKRPRIWVPGVLLVFRASKTVPNSDLNVGQPGSVSGRAGELYLVNDDLKLEKAGVFPLEMSDDDLAAQYLDKNKRCATSK
jgi:hypothetical protein